MDWPVPTRQSRNTTPSRSWNIHINIRITVNILINYSNHLFYLNSSSQLFWSQDPFILLKINEDFKEPLFMWVIAIVIYQIRKLKLKNYKNI